MILTSTLFSKKKIQLILLLTVLTLFCTVLLAYRILSTERLTYAFLVWNLFLAIIPFLISLLLINLPQKFQKGVMIFPLLIVWLLFLPNAFYIITDLIHLRQKDDFPLWFDLMLLFSFAWNGLFVGYLSISDIHDWIQANSSKTLAWLLSFVIIMLCSFGVYLGRYLRWNSWDVFAHPMMIIGDIANRFIDPFAYKTTWGMTITYGIFLIIGYAFMRVLFENRPLEKNN